MEESIKFRKIAERIRETLRQPDFPVGSVLESERHLMIRFGISRQTVRDALKMLVAEGLIVKHHGKGSILVRKPADKTKLRRGIQLGLIGNREMIDAAQSDYAACAGAIVDRVHVWGANLSLFPCLSRENPAGARYLRELLSGNLADGFFLANMPDLRESVDFLEAAGIPFVLLFPCPSPSPIPAFSRYPGVIAEELGPLTDLLRRVAADGVTRIVLPCFPDDLQPERTRDMLARIAPAIGVEVEFFAAEDMGLDAILNLLRRVRGPETLLIVSNAAVEVFDFAIRHLGIRLLADLRVLLFRHYAPDWSKWQTRYPVFLRDIAGLAAAAAERMHRLILRKECGQPLPPGEEGMTVFPARIAGRTDLLRSIG